MQTSDVTMWGRDYSAREWTPEQFDEYERANPGEPPIQFLRRYIGYPGNGKCISAYNGMYRRHWEAGRPVGLFHQIGYTDMEGGHDRGRQHALTAKADAESARVGWRGESHIVACMDRFYVKQGYRTLTAWDLSEYMRGYRSVLGDRSGFYGFYDSMRDAINGGWASYYVQCGARSAHVPGIHEWQENNYQPPIGGVDTDILEMYTSPQYAFGIGGPGGGAGRKEEDDMALIKGDAGGPDVYVVGAEGKRHVKSEAEMNAFGGAAAVKVLPQADVDDIPNIGTLVWNYDIPVEDVDDPTVFRPAHRVVAGIYEHVADVVADVDEATLAVEMKKQGISSGATPAQVKAALTEVLRSVPAATP